MKTIRRGKCCLSAWVLGASWLLSCGANSPTRGSTPPTTPAPSDHGNPQSPVLTATAVPTGSDVLSTRHGQIIPRMFSSILTLLDHLADSASAFHAGEEDEPPRLDGAVMSTCLSSDGIVFGPLRSTDDAPPTIQLSKQEILHQLEARTGRAYDEFRQLGRLYYVDNVTYHEVRIINYPGGAWVEIGSSPLYRLEFVEVGGRYVLKRLQSGIGPT